ncbi:MAG: hypothetical protein COZ57_10425 [Armatimonadetes bacterium CG_4_8_14_3_um_filter_66_20]|nr:MAG: hypothetical protein COZ57_10425 [Armatimonadetes bacterium CG_4_8_14_3_um_filter_66_20]
MQRRDNRLWLLPVLLTLCAQGGWTMDCHVSPTGNDANTGTGPEDGKALRTLQAGVDKLQPGDTLLVHGGVYRETVTFPRSGEPGKPITVKAADGEEVTVTGCDPVTGWTKQEGNLWKAPMPWTLGLGRNQVFAGGAVLIEARFPNEPDPGLGMYVSDLSPLWPTFGEFSIPDPKGSPGRLVSKLLDGQPDDYWKGACYYGVHYEGWSAQTGIIESSKSGEITVGDRTRTWWFGPAYGGGYKPEEGRGMIVGHMHALDAPGEWVWQDDTLYLIPTGGGEPTSVEAKRRQLVFDLSGQEQIRIEGLTIRAASMRLEGSANCVIDRCDLSYISHFTRFYAIGQIEDGRDTIKSGETGIFVGGHDNSFLNCSVRFSAGAGFYLRGYHHTIHNCLIDEIDYTSHYLNAITDAVSDFGDYENMLVGGHVITYNTMRNAGRHFFNFYGNGTSTASRDRAPMDYMATLFAHNHLYNGMLETKDAGLLTGYYSSGGTLDGLNSQVCYNVLHDSYDLAAMRWGVLGIVYLDAGTCDVDLHHNLLWAAPGSLQRGLWYNTMCVDVHEHDNVFHLLFTRTCAELKPADFPEGKPFRFGHDFGNPPPLPVWPQLEALRLTDPLDRTDRTDLTDRASFSLGNVDFNRGWQSLVVRFASDAKGMNTDRSGRAKPRHQKATDPLVLEATVNDGKQEQVRQQWTFLYNFSEGAWIRFNQVPLGEGYRRFRVIYGNEQPAPRQLEVHLDSADGSLVGKIDLPQTDKARGGRIQIYGEAVGDIAPEATGTRDVFLVCHSDDDKPVGEFEYFRFEQYRGQIPLQPNEVKLELRVGSKDGEKIGEVYPRATGGAEVSRDFVAKLEPAKGTQPLFLVVRSSVEGPVGAINSVSLEKAKQPIDWTGVSNPPLSRDGKLVFPEPTNLPCAKPADKYAGAAAAARPRPVIAATRVKSPPAIDGRLDEWEATAQTMTLGEDWDGSQSTATPSTAWIGYDDAALYVAAKTPVKDGTKLDFASHVWGATDAMEIAVQDGFAAKPGPILNVYGWPDGHFLSTDQAGAPAAAVDRLRKAVTYRAAAAKDSWACEWRIPFSATGFTPKTASRLLLNLGVRKVADVAWVIWRGTGGQTYLVGNAGVLVFPGEFLSSNPLPRDKLEVWLDAADDATIEKDDAGKVAVWKDSSGNGRDARQDTPDFRPLYEPAGLNERPALRFDEKAKTRLELPDLSAEKITATVFTVFSNPEPCSEVNHDQRIFTASDGKEFDYQVGLAATVPGMETGGPRQSVQVFTDRWAKRVHVGCFSPNYQTFLHGLLSEVLVYSRTLSREEQDCVRAYLALKWGVE